MFDDFDTQVQCEEAYEMPGDIVVYYDPEFIIERAGDNVYRIVWHMWENVRSATVESTLEDAIFLGESFGQWD